MRYEYNQMTGRCGNPSIVSNSFVAILLMMLAESIPWYNERAEGSIQALP